MQRQKLKWGLLIAVLLLALLLLAAGGMIVRFGTASVRRAAAVRPRRGRVVEAGSRASAPSPSA